VFRLGLRTSRVGSDSDPTRSIQPNSNVDIWNPYPTFLVFGFGGFGLGLIRIRSGMDGCGLSEWTVKMWKRNLHHLSVCHGFLHLLRNLDYFHHHVTAQTDQTPLPRHLQYKSETISSPTTQIGVDGFIVTKLSIARTCMRHKTRSEDANSIVDCVSPPPPQLLPLHHCKLYHPPLQLVGDCASPKVENDDILTMTNLFQRQNRLLGRCLQLRCKKLETEEKLCLKDCWFSKVGSGEGSKDVGNKLGLGKSHWLWVGSGNHENIK